MSTTRKIRLGLQVNNLLDQHYYANAQTTSDFFKNKYIQVEPSSPRALFGSVTMMF
jgi:hypothetical protein